VQIALKKFPVGQPADGDGFVFHKNYFDDLKEIRVGSSRLQVSQPSCSCNSVTWMELRRCS